MRVKRRTRQAYCVLTPYRSISQIPCRPGIRGAYALYENSVLDAITADRHCRPRGWAPPKNAALEKSSGRGRHRVVSARAQQRSGRAEGRIPRTTSAPMGAAPSGCRTSRQSISSPRSARSKAKQFRRSGPRPVRGPSEGGGGCLQRSEAAVPNSEFPPLSRSACTTQSDARVAQSAACTTLRACATLLRARDLSGPRDPGP